jgi:hypothetical protein
MDVFYNLLIESKCTYIRVTKNTSQRRIAFPFSSFKAIYCWLQKQYIHIPHMYVNVYINM